MPSAHDHDLGGDSGVTVRIAGAFAVERDGQPAVAAALGSRKARALLKVLAVERGRLVPVDRLSEVLWGATPPQRPAENVATLVSRLRAALGAGAIIGGRDGYRLGSAPAVRVDLDDAAAEVAAAERLLAEAAPAFAALAAQRAVDRLGDGPALAEDPYADWAEPARTEATALLRRARHAAAEAGLGTGDGTAALFAADAVAADPVDEVACRLLMRAYVARAEPARALAAFERLRGNLEHELGVDPAPQTRDLHVAILREDQQTVAPPDTVGTQQAGVEGSPLLGRAEEQRRLEEHFAAAAAGRGGLVLITGEAGIGKTRLAEQTAALADRLGATVLRARCYDAERSLFLQPFAELFGQLAARTLALQLRPLVGDRLSALATLMPSSGWPEGPPGASAAASTSGHAELQRRRVFESVAGLLRELSARGPVLVFLDDLHSAGLSTVELLHYVGRNLGVTRLMIVATVRVEEGQSALAALADVSTRLDLGPLPADAVRALAAEAGHAEMAERILHQTRGHALYVVETLRGLRAGESGLPATLQAAVLARVRRAGEPTEALLRTAAVVGAALNPLVLARIMGESSPVVVRRCEEALAARLLVVAGREYEFANDLIREVLYATTPEPTRVAHHLRAAELLDDQPEVVAGHAAAAGDWPRAARAYLVAGEMAMRRFAAGDAHALLDRALAAVHSREPSTADTAGQPGSAGPELLGRIYIARARVREALKRYPEGLDDLRAAAMAAHDAGDRRLEMMALLHLSGDVPIALGVPIAESIGHLRRGLRIAESLADRGAEATLLSRLAALNANALDLAAAANYGRRAVAAGRAGGADPTLAAGLDGLKTAHFFLGDIDALADVVDELEPLLRRSGDLFGLQWTVFESAFVPFGRGDWDGALRRFELAIDINRRSGFTAYEGWFLAHVGMLARLRDRSDDALEHGRRAVALADDSPHPWWLPLTHSLLAATLLELGDAEAAVPLLRRAREVAGVSSGAPAHLAFATALLAEATGSAAMLAEAVSMLDAITAPPGMAWLYGFETYLCVARSWLSRDEPQRARDALQPLLGAALRAHWVPALTEGLLVDAKAALALHHPDAPAQLDGVVELARRHGLVRITRAAEIIGAVAPA